MKVCDRKLKCDDHIESHSSINLIFGPLPGVVSSRSSGAELARQDQSVYRRTCQMTEIQTQHGDDNKTHAR